MRSWITTLGIALALTACEPTGETDRDDLQEQLRERYGDEALQEKPQQGTGLEQGQQQQQIEGLDEPRMDVPEGAMDVPEEPTEPVERPITP